MNILTLSSMLIELGLEKTQAKMYAFVLLEGPQSFLQLSKKLNIQRAKVYRDIEDMIEKGYVMLSNDEWGKKIVAVSLDILKEKLEAEVVTFNQKLQQINQISQELKFNEPDSTIEEIRDISVITTMLKNFLENESKIYIRVDESLFEDFPDMFLEKFKYSLNQHTDKKVSYTYDKSIVLISENSILSITKQESISAEFIKCKFAKNLMELLFIPEEI